jgi:hypothetical protein
MPSAEGPDAPSGQGPVDLKVGDGRNCLHGAPLRPCPTASFGPQDQWPGNHRGIVHLFIR